MLPKMLAVGVGGSGGWTLRAMRDELQRRLRVRGYTAGIPAGWQFLHVDVPQTQDGEDAGIPFLPQESYLGLGRPGVKYKFLDEAVTAQAESFMSVAGWRPDPSLVFVNLQSGAGQYRALGRMVVSSEMSRVRRAIADRVTDMRTTEADEQMKEVSRLFGTPPSKEEPQPIILVATSIAGGAGAGMFLDVCDALHATSEKIGDKITGILYAPDLFKNLPKAHRAGTNGNALAALAEFMAGAMNKEAPGENEFTTLQLAQMQVVGIETRGPDMPFIIGSSNRKIEFSEPQEVFRATGHALALWVADAEVNLKLGKAVLGNWSSTKDGSGRDLTRLSYPNAKFLSSFGYASVGLARERFSRYAARRLSGLVVNTLLEGHRDGADDDESVARLRTALAEMHKTRFLEAAKLREAGEGNNEIQDALAELQHSRWTAKLVDETRDKIVQDALKGKGSDLTPEKAATVLAARLAESSTQFQIRWAQSLETSAAEWVNQTQQRVLRAAAEVVSQSGLEVTARTLELVRDELLNTVIPELQADLNRIETSIDVRKAQAPADIIRGALTDAVVSLTRSRPQISAAVDQALARTEARRGRRLLLNRAISLTASLCSDFLEPLRLSLLREVEQLSHASRGGTPDRKSALQGWRDLADGTIVPSDLEPPKNELLLERLEDFPSIFGQQLSRATGQPDLGTASKRAVAAILTGSGAAAEDSPSFLQVDQRWLPANAAEGVPGQKARFTLNLQAADIYRSVDGWLQESDIGAYMREPLREYLDPVKNKAVRADQLAARLAKFSELLSLALDMAEPLCDIDETMRQRIHEDSDTITSGLSMVLSEVPFPPGLARDAALTVFRARGKSDSDIPFGEGNAQTIEITTFLGSPYNPVVFSSLIAPIAQELERLRAADTNGLGEFWKWRRARQLPYAIPLHPKYRRAIIRGWWMARLMGQVRGIEEKTFNSEAVKVWVPNGWAEFPFPVLGPRLREAPEVLPALLESLPLALVDAASQKNLDPLSAYHRLLDLGLGGAFDEAVSDDEPLHPEFQLWLEGGGEKGGGVPTPAIQRATSRTDRTAAVVEHLEAAQERFRTLAAVPLRKEDPLSVRRSWELREDILGALHSLIARCKEEQSTDDDFGIG